MNLGLNDSQKDVGVGLENQDFINWMRVAAFPTFRKLYRKLDHAKEAIFADRLPAGKYELNIEYSELQDQSVADFLGSYCLQSAGKLYGIAHLVHTQNFPKNFLTP